MNPFQRLGVKISNWWRGEPQDSGGVVTLNSPSFLERIGLKRKGKPTSEVTYFTCLKMLSETLAKMCDFMGRYSVTDLRVDCVHRT